MTRDPRREDGSTAAASGGSGGAAAIAVALALAVVFLAVFLYRFPPAAAALARIVQPAVAAGMVLLAGYAAGRLALSTAGALFRRMAGLSDTGERAEASAALLVGLPAFGTMVALLAWTGVAIELLVSLLTLLMAGAGALLLARRRPGIGGAGVWDVALLGAPVAVGLVAALSPVNSPDELVYKLAVPKAYLLFGGMIDLPLNSYSYASTALSHVSLAALALSGGMAAKLVHWALFLAALVTLRRLGERLAPGAGTWVAAVLAWTPALMLIAGWAWTEWGVLATLLLSYRGWLEFEARPSASAAALVTSALAGAAAIKYTALPWIAVFAVVAIARLARRGLVAGPEGAGRGARPLLAAAAIVMAALGAFFYLRNWVWSGSPVAPFLLPGAPMIERYRSQGSLAGWQELLLGYDIMHSGIIDDALGVVLPASSLLAPLGALRYRGARDLFWIGLVPLPFLVAMAPTSRLMLTSLAPLAVVGAVYLAQSWRAIESAIVRGLVSAVAALTLAMQLVLVLYILVTSYDPLSVLVGAETDGGYVARMRPYAKAYRWVAEHTPPHARILLIGDNRSYALERPTFCAGNFDGPRMAKFLGQHADAPALLQHLRLLGVTHMVVHWPWLRVEGRAASPPDMLEREYILPLPRATAQVLQDFVDHVAVRRYQDDGYSVYELPAAEAAPP